MNVPEIVVDGDTTHSKRQSFLGFLDKTKQRFRSPSPGRSRGNSVDVKIESLVNSFTWTDDVPSQARIADFKTKIRWVEKAQRVLNVEQKYDSRIASASPASSREPSPSRKAASPPPLVLSRDRERQIDPSRDPRTDLRPGTHQTPPSSPPQVTLSRSPARHSRQEWDRVTSHVPEGHVPEGHVPEQMSPGNAAYMNKHANRISKTPEAFDFEEFGASLDSREATRGNELRQTKSRDSHKLRQTVSRDSQLTAVDLSPQRLIPRELSPGHQKRDRGLSVSRDHFGASPDQLHMSRDALSPQVSRDRQQQLTDYSATINSVTNLQQDGKLEQAHNLMASAVTRSDLGWAAQNNDPTHVTPLLTLTLMYGLSLRHGWGGEKDELRAFRYICGAAVGLTHVNLTLLNEDMSSSDKKTQILHRSALKTALSSLAQSLYELGNCYHYGWGVTTSSAVAQIYYECGGWLGDEDAQEQRGRLLGDSKKFEEKKIGANWLRVAQKKEGHSTAGESWVWKEKYDE
ncbi:hypothetical protein CJU89_3704 [Yarrowia sp. B02]|nr:hypothetical protein CJU89_3704 [Yarrowia sp. B02]